MNQTQHRIHISTQTLQVPIPARYLYKHLKNRLAAISSQSQTPYFQKFLILTYSTHFILLLEDLGNGKTYSNTIVRMKKFQFPDGTQQIENLSRKFDFAKQTSLDDSTFFTRHFFQPFCKEPSGGNLGKRACFSGSQKDKLPRLTTFDNYGYSTPEKNHKLKITGSLQIKDFVFPPGSRKNTENWDSSNKQTIKRKDTKRVKTGHGSPKIPDQANIQNQRNSKTQSNKNDSEEHLTKATDISINPRRSQRLKNLQISHPKNSLVKPSNFNIISLEKIFFPFSKTFQSFYNSSRQLKYFDLLSKLRNLKTLFGAIFLYEQPINFNICHLTNFEKEVLKRIILHKNYFGKNHIVKQISQLSTHTSCQVHHTLLQLQRTKRKEENLKFTFRILIKFLITQFKQNNQRFWDQHPELSSFDVEIIFYLYYFSQNVLNQPFQVSLNKYIHSHAFRENAKAHLGDFVFPDINNPASISKFKTYTKKFFNLLSQSSKPLFDQLIYKLLTLVVFMGKRRSFQYEQMFLRSKVFCKKGLFKEILNGIVQHNDREITKTISEWENVINRKYEPPHPKFNIQHPPEDRNLLHIIATNIKSSNFKLPWTFREVQDAFMDGFISLTQNYQRSRGHVQENCNLLFLYFAFCILHFDTLFLSLSAIVFLF